PRPPRRSPFPYTTLFRSADKFHPGLGAITALQRLAHLAKAVHQAEVEAARAGPEQAGKERFLVGKPAAAALLHHGDEDLVDLARSEEHTSELQSRENLLC